MPPLRERAGDIHTLAQAFLTDAATRAGKPVPRLSTGALNALSAYAWPGNVRELRNTIERAVVFVDGGVITPDDLELDLSPALPDLAVARDAASESAGSYREACQFAERAAGRTYLSALLRRHHGSVSACARHEGVERETMHRWLKRHGLDASGFRGERETVTDQPTP